MISSLPETHLITKYQIDVLYIHIHIVQLILYHGYFPILLKMINGSSNFFLVSLIIHLTTSHCWTFSFFLMAAADMLILFHSRLLPQQMLKSRTQITDFSEQKKTKDYLKQKEILVHLSLHTP